jgi:GDP-L-fucose synthase
MLEVTSRAYRQQHGCNFTCVIPTNIYGPNDNFYEGCHFIPSIIKRTFRAMQDGCDTMIIPGTGKALRQFIYSRDLAQILIWTLRNYDEVEPLLVSVNPEDEVSVKSVVSMVCSISNFQGSIHWDITKTDGQLRKTADNSKMRGLVEDFKFTPLLQGNVN